MRLLVTGGAGFVGSHVVEALLGRGDDVLVVDDLSTGDRRNVAARADLRVVDVADDEALLRACGAQRFDAVVHAAAEARVVVTVRDPARSHRANVRGTENVLHLAEKTRARRFVFFSTGGALYGETPVCAKETDATRPISPYGQHKLEAEGLVRRSGLPYAILRPGNIYGPRQRGDLEAGVIAIFLQRWRARQQLVIYGDGSAERDYVHVEDVADFVTAALSSSLDGTWNVGTGVATSVNRLVEILRHRLGDPPGGVRYAPAREGELLRSCLDPALAERDGLWRPRIALQAGMASLAARQRIP